MTMVLGIDVGGTKIAGPSVTRLARWANSWRLFSWPIVVLSQPDKQLQS